MRIAVIDGMGGGLAAQVVMPIDRQASGTG